jgi:hypothetical protein
MRPVLPAGCVIALIGAEGSGKTTLAHALVQRFIQREIAASCVPDLVHEWRKREGRTPDAGEQTIIAAAQTRRIADATARGIVIADTTALMTILRGHHPRLKDNSLHAAAIAAHRSYALTLLLATREPSNTETLLRDALMAANLPYSVVHGERSERLAQAWDAIRLIADPDDGPQPTRTTWAWTCDKCSDPACEHRLFSDLVAGRR